jgi:hypothetical protein
MIGWGKLKSLLQNALFTAADSKTGFGRCLHAIWP